MPFNLQPALQGLRRFQPDSTVAVPTVPLNLTPHSALLYPDELTRPGLDTGPPVPRDPVSLSYLAKSRFKDQLHDRLFAAQRSGDVKESQALQGLIQSTEQDLAENPITAQKAQSDLVGKANLDAQLRGFAGGVPRPAGMEPDFPGGRSFTSTPALMPAQQAAGAQRAFEAYKAGMPEEVARLRGESATEVERQRAASLEEVNKAKLEAQRGIIQFLQDFKSRNPDADINLPGGGGIRTKTAAQSAPGKVGEQEEAQLNRKLGWLAELRNPNFMTKLKWQTGFYGSEPTIEETVKNLQTQVAQHQQNLGRRPVAAAPSRRQQAIDALTSAGHPVTEANIQHLLNQNR